MTTTAHGSPALENAFSGKWLLYTLTLVAAVLIATGAVAAMSEEADAEVTATLSGTTVTLSGSGAFTGCPNVTSIAISSTLKSIGTDAFSDMTFYDYDSNEISKTAANLARGYFSGTTSSELYLW